jgi:RND family efflux transporter MFP subunit
MSDRRKSGLYRHGFIVLAGCAALAACEQEAPPERAPVVRPVKLLTIGAVGAGPTLELPGSVTATQQSDMAFEVPGRIIEIPVDEGEMVASGAVLARLDARDYEADLDKVLARRNAARADFNRYDEAFKADAVTAQDVDLARRNLDVTEAELRTARKAVEDTVLRAPFDGRVARKLVDDFANVRAKQTVLIVQDDSSIEIRVNIAERDWGRARPGLSNAERTALIRPRVVIASMPGRQFPATIKEIATSADPVTRTYEATFAFANPADVNVSPGMTGRVVLSIPEDTDVGAVTLIPANAVMADEENNPYVWVVDPDTEMVGIRKVQVGELSGVSIQVIDGLQDGDRIAVSGVHSLTEGAPVRALEN